MRLAITSEFRLIEHEWRAFEKRADYTPFQSFDWLLTWQRCIGSRAGVKPAIVTGHQSNRELLFVLPLAIERTPFGRRCVFFGYDVCDYNAPLLAPEFPAVIRPPDFANWWRVIQKFMLRKPEFNYDVLFLEKMPERIGTQENPMLALATILRPARAYRANLGDDWESFYASKRSSATRSRDRTKRRRLGDSGELRITTLQDPEERQTALRILFSQKGRFFARIKEPNMFEQPKYSDFYLSVAAAAGPLIHISRLDVGRTCAAINLGLQFRGCYYYVLASYDDGVLSRFGPGAMHLRELMRYAISQRFKHFDFTIGEHPYKLEWADEEAKLYDHIAATSWSGVPGAAAITLKRDARRMLRKYPLLWQLTVQLKPLVGSLRSLIGCTKPLLRW
jgi:CelD/BcsL family acetyltransferase involved in cellulose biosynthesis